MEKRKTDQWFNFITLNIFKKQSAPFFIDVWKNVKRLHLNVLIQTWSQITLVCGCADTPSVHLFLWPQLLLWVCGKDFPPDSDTWGTTPNSTHFVRNLLYILQEFTVFPNSAAILSRCTYGIEVGISRQPMIWYYRDTSLMVRYYCHLAFCDMLTEAYIVIYNFKFCPQR